MPTPPTSITRLRAPTGTRLSAAVLCGLLGVAIGGCVATGDDDPVLLSTPANDGTREVTVQLQAIGESPSLATVQLHASPVIDHTQTIAQGNIQVNGINTVLVGSNCTSLRAEYPELDNCTESKETTFSYGDVEASATTDENGRATLHLNPGKYQITVGAPQSDSDPTCGWSGAAMLDSSSDFLSVPLVQFCQ